MTDVDLVKAFVRALGRLGRGDVAAIRLAGLARADVERQALVVGLLEDAEPLLQQDTTIEALDDGDIELTRSGTSGETAVINVGELTA